MALAVVGRAAPVFSDVRSDEKAVKMPGVAAEFFVF
jgi:hypothetical protein